MSFETKVLEDGLEAALEQDMDINSDESQEWVEVPTPPSIEIATSLMSLQLFPTIRGDCEVDPTRGLIGTGILDALGRQVVSLIGNQMAVIWSKSLASRSDIVLSGNIPPVTSMFNEQGELLKEYKTDSAETNMFLENIYAEIQTLYELVTQIVVVHQEKFPMRVRGRMPVGVSLAYVSNVVDGLPWKIGDTIHGLSDDTFTKAIKMAVRYTAMSNRAYRGMVATAKNTENANKLADASSINEALSW